MPEHCYLDIRLARLFGDWLAHTAWNEALYTLLRDFLDGARMDKPVQTRYAAEGDEAAAQRETLRTGLAELAVHEAHNPAIAALATRFSLAPTEMAIINFFYLYLAHPSLEAYVDKLPEHETIKRIARSCALDEQALLSALSPGATLAATGLGTTDGHALRLPKYGLTFGLSGHVLTYIATEGRQPLASFLFDTSEKPSLPLSAHDLPAATVATAQATLKSSRGKAFILVYGKPGTGKTEFSRSLAASCGYTPRFLGHDRDDGTRSYANLLLAARLVDPATEVLVVDEADELFNLKPGPFSSAEAKGGVKKSMVNNFLDGAEARIIFITNEIRHIPDSIVRRFCFHLGFEDFTLTQRSRIWNEMDVASRVFADTDRARLAARYRANPARIRQVLDVCGSLDPGEGIDAPGTLAVAEEMLSRGDEILYGVPRREQKTPGSYDPAFLNLDTSTGKLLDSLERWKDAYLQKQQGINLLFYGLPGTGKTAFAHHLADHLGLPTIVKRASDLVSPFVGETEQNIKAAFHEAEGAVLIFDEADSLIVAREDARYNWERTRTNEVLTCMEDFKGVFIASTNFKKILDSASFRRFTFKIEFRPPAPAQRLRLVESYFPHISFPEQLQDEIFAMDRLTPGDVATAADRLRYSVGSDAPTVLAALKEESAQNGPRLSRIGFGS